MSERPSPSTINQTASGNDNIQVAGSNNVITRITKFFARDTEARRFMRNRHAMLELVKNTWIKGVLEKSLYNEVLIELGMEKHVSAVEYPWDVQIQIPYRENQTLSAGTSIFRVFNEMNGAMLILGEPGSGKTTMLLELARECISCAEQDDSRPIPVVFNLSSWDGRHTIEAWLESELNTKYNVPKKMAQAWVQNDDLHLLLDGLDEVKMEDREASVRAINYFRQEHGLTVPIAICSRVADYETLTTKLSLSGAVLLQPLATAQIDQYFDQAGVELEGLRQILKNDQAIQELAKQPLMLSIMTLAYQGKSTDTFDIGYLETIEDRRRHLFEAYIERMYERVARTKREAYAPEQTNRWLSWLAQIMIAKGQTVLFIDQIYMLLHPATQILLQRIIALIVLGVLISGHLLLLFLGSLEEIAVLASFFVLITCSFLVVVNIIIHRLRSTHANGLEDARKSQRPSNVLTFSWRKSFPGIVAGLFLGLVTYVIFPAPIVQLIFSLIDGFGLGLISGLVLKRSAKSYGENDEKDANNNEVVEFPLRKVKLMSKFILEKITAKQEWSDSPLIKPTEILKWSWARALHGLVVGMSIGFITGVIGGLTSGLIYAILLQNVPEYGFRLGFIMGLPYGSLAGVALMVFLGLIGLVLYGLNKESLENKSYPNQGIRQSFKNAGITVLVTGFSFAVLGLVLSPLIFSVSQSIFEGMNITLGILSIILLAGLAFVVGVLIGGLFSLYYGGYAVIYHYCVRLILFHSDYIPWKLIPFLDYCVDRIFLRHVGGGYIFVHRLLMEHFAAMDPEEK